VSAEATLAARFGALTSDQVAALDHAAHQAGVSVVQLMEVAGWQVARCAWQLLGDAPGQVAVVAGRGNNGGDGLVAARFLAAWGCEVSAAMIAEPGSVAGVVAEHVHSARANGVHVVLRVKADAVVKSTRGAALVLDGILGTGLRAAPREPQASIIRALNSSGRRILAIDVPSGLDASSGEVFDPCIHAAATCTLVAAKAGLWSDRGRQQAGALWVADIGMPRAAWAFTGLAQPGHVRGGVLLSVPTATSF
jgi:NAD(P)H-hydrate epimerase